MSQQIFDLRAVHYSPGAGRLGPLSLITSEVTTAFGAIPTVTAETSELYATIPDVIELGVEYWTAAGWVEPLDSRFLITKTSNDERDPASVWKLEGVGLVQWLMSKCTLAVAGTMVDGKRPFNSSTPGAIIATFLEEAQIRGWAPFVDFGFTASVDSDGAAWGSTLTIHYAPGLNAWQALTNLADQGVLEFATQGRELKIWNPGKFEATPTLRLGDRSQTVNVNRDMGGLLTDAVVSGDGLLLDIPNVGAYADLGRLEVLIAQGGVSDVGTATLLAQAELVQGSQTRREVTVRYDVAELPDGTAPPLPWADFGYGWVEAPFDGGWAPAQVRQITVTKGEAGISCGITLSDRFESDLARIAKRTSGIVGGAVAGGSGAVPASEDRRRPKPPVGLVVSSTGYWNTDGTPLSQVSAEWTPVTQGENDVAISIALYELWGRPDDGATESNAITTSETALAYWSPFTPLQAWLFKVRAQSTAGVWGDFSTEASVTTAAPFEDLSVPSTPLLSTANGVVIVAWDGSFATDPPSGPPESFREMVIEISGTAAGEYQEIGSLMVANTSYAVAGFAVGTSLWFRFRAIDRLGRSSAASAVMSVSVAGVDGGGIIPATVSVDALQAGSITVDYLAPGIGADLQISGNVVIQTLSSDIAAVVTDVNGVEVALAEQRTRYDFDENELRISQPGSAKAFAFTNDRIEARDGTTVMAYWEQGTFNAPHIVVTDLVVGGHKIEPGPSGGTVWRPLM